jgi:tRNA(Ile)-lysidine synthetase-like protein
LKNESDLLDALRRLAGQSLDFAIAFSGGPDSLALARLACAAGLKPRLLHVDHQTPSSSKGAQAATKLARDLGLDFSCLRVELGQGSRGFEAQAREQRYAALAQASKAPIWLAHTRDDYVETVWLRLLAGAAPQYWKTMPEARGQFRRPLLKVWRAELGNFGEGGYVDPMNAETRFDRVWLRHSGLLAELDAKGEIADAAAALGARVQALRLESCLLPLHELPPGLRFAQVRARLGLLLPQARPRSRFVAEVVRVAAHDSSKPRSFSLANRVIHLRHGQLLLNS